VQRSLIDSLARFLSCLSVALPQLLRFSMVLQHIVVLAHEAHGGVKYASQVRFRSAKTMCYDGALFQPSVT